MKSPKQNQFSTATPDSKASGSRPSGRGKAKAAYVASPHADQTENILRFLKDAHGNTQVNPEGDFYFGEVSTISLHLLLSCGLPEKELLWAWYRHFDKGLSQSIYQTLPPLRDQEFLDMLRLCDFEFDEARLAECGLLFLVPQRTLVMNVVEQALIRRLDAYHAMDDSQLKKVLTPGNTRSEVHLRRLVRKIRTEPVDGKLKQQLYARLDSDYQRATARQLLDEATSDSFWKEPPHELESVRARLAILYRILLESSLRLGVYGAESFTREDFSRRTQAGYKGSNNGHHGAKQKRARDTDYFPGSVRWEMEAHHFSTLGLKTESTLDEVRAAYREKVKAHHPDQGGSLQEFLRVQEAYEYLISEVY